MAFRDVASPLVGDEKSRVDAAHEGRRYIFQRTVRMSGAVPVFPLVLGTRALA
jgi:hypothetical protein